MHRTNISARQLARRLRRDDRLHTRKLWGAKRSRLQRVESRTFRRGGDL